MPSVCRGFFSFSQKPDTERTFAGREVLFTRHTMRPRERRDTRAGKDKEAAAAAGAGAGAGGMGEAKETRSSLSCISHVGAIFLFHFLTKGRAEKKKRTEWRTATPPQRRILRAGTRARLCA